MTRRKLIAANWKMNKTIAEARSFADAVVGALESVPPCDLLVIPPFLALPSVAGRFADTGVEVGAQNLYFEASGAFTGEVSGDMVRDAGAQWVLVGHSERRHVMGESDETVARKLEAALKAGLKPILCVGETLDERRHGNAEVVVTRQLSSALVNITADNAADIVIAYEPVWAIGTGQTATPFDAVEMHRVARAFVAERFSADVAQQIRIQYGGSVKPANAQELLGRDEIDGALVGGASLDAESFLAIAHACGPA